MECAPSAILFVTDEQYVELTSCRKSVRQQFGLHFDHAVWTLISCGGKPCGCMQILCVFVTNFILTKVRKVVCVVSLKRCGTHHQGTDLVSFMTTTHNILTAQHYSK